MDNYTGKIIAAVKNADEFEKSLKSEVTIIFYLYPDIMELAEAAEKAHTSGKNLYIHIDLTTGLGKDRSGIEFAKRAGVDGIISTRASLIKLAKECGLRTVQRLFIVDSQSIDTTVETVKKSKPDFIEVMPGISPKIVKILSGRVDIPIITGGLIDSLCEVKTAIESGAYAISTGCVNLWEVKI